MEDVLDLYQPEYNPERPVVCFDETSRQLTGEVRPPIEAAPGRVARYDTEYQQAVIASRRVDLAPSITDVTMGS